MSVVESRLQRDLLGIPTLDLEVQLVEDTFVIKGNGCWIKVCMQKSSWNPFSWSSVWLPEP